MCWRPARTSARLVGQVGIDVSHPPTLAALAWRSARAAGRLHPHGDGECPTTPHFVRHVGCALHAGQALSATQALDHRPPEEPHHDHLIPEPRDKAMARHLRAALADRGVTVSHAEALELVARQLGMRDWNTLAAASSRDPGGGPRPPRRSCASSTRPAALSFYVDYLDFRVDWRNETGGHEPLYAQQLSRGDVHLSGHHGDASPGSGVLVPVPMRSTSSSRSRPGVRVREPGIEDQPWGQAVTVIDPFSNRIVFAEANAPGETPVDAEPRPAEAAAPIVLHIWVAGPPRRAFEVFTERFGEWWPRRHTPRPIRGIRVEPRVGGEVAMLLEGGDARPARRGPRLRARRHYAQSFTLAQDPRTRAVLM